MSARRRSRTRKSGDPSTRQAQPQRQRKGTSGQDRSGRKKRNRSPKRRPAGPDFWGDAAAMPTAQPDVRITDDPAAVVRSLGHAPLTGHEAIAEHYFTAVYMRAVTTAGAIAAAGGMIEPEELEEELAD
jgi:hypothetical protein